MSRRLVQGKTVSVDVSSSQRCCEGRELLDGQVRHKAPYFHGVSRKDFSSRTAGRCAAQIASHLTSQFLQYRSANGVNEVLEPPMRRGLAQPGRQVRVAEPCMDNLV